MPPTHVVVPFTSENLYKQLASGACLQSDVADNARAKYLFGYLTEIGATTIVTELEYVDADYLDDYASFYAKSFDTIPNRCRRLHFFNAAMDEQVFKSLVLSGGSKGAIQQSYLGFVVARPLPTAVIGRTVISTYESDAGRRHYPAIRTYQVNLFGIQLSVNSLAFQEQDTSLAACATVALWSCFQKTQDLFHSLAPSPVAITRAANRLLLAARPFPSRGLQIQQVCNAVAAVGLDPEVYEVTPDLPLVSLVYSYLRLGLPVLAVVEISGVGLHAIAITGYSLRETRQICSEAANVNSLLPALVGLRIDELYGHDDQNGPFSRMKLVEPTSNNPTVLFSGTGWPCNLAPKAIVVPVYPKIRTGFREVLKWLPVFSIVASWVAPAQEFEWDVHLTTSNDFKAFLRDNHSGMSAEMRETLLLSGLPKYLWRCTLSVQGTPLLEALLDTTAMVNGFPVKTLWWCDEQKAAAIRSLASNSQLASHLTPILGARLVEILGR
jgi:hypothetical protein